MEPSWNLTSGPPRTTPEPIWAETPKLSAVGEKPNKLRNRTVSEPPSDHGSTNSFPKQVFPPGVQLDPLPILGPLAQKPTPGGCDVMGAHRLHLHQATIEVGGGAVQLLASSRSPFQFCSGGCLWPLVTYGDPMGRNTHVPPFCMFTRGTGFDPQPYGREKRVWHFVGDPSKMAKAVLLVVSLYPKKGTLNRTQAQRAPCLSVDF